MYEARAELERVLKQRLRSSVEFEIVPTSVGQVRSLRLVVKIRRGTYEDREPKYQQKLMAELRDLCWDLYLHRGLVVEPEIKVIEE